MAADISPTLFHPFEAGFLPLPGVGWTGIVFDARPGMRIPAEFGTKLHRVQGFRPHFLGLEREGGTVSPGPQGADYDIAMVIAGRHRRQNEAWVAEAITRTRTGGMVLVAGGKTDGITSLRKRVSALFPLVGSASKYHGVVFWLQRPPEAGLVETLRTLTLPLEPVEGRFLTARGGFSAERVDPASRLLADNLPADISGRVADFCAGWGYLSVRLAERAGVSSVDLYEADFESLEAARLNMAGLAPELAAQFHWCDLAAEQAGERYDAIVMNPPFHQSREADPDIGLRIIAAARGALRPGGRLFLVANKGLPYEKALVEGFRTRGEIVRDGSYKVLWAAR